MSAMRTVRAVALVLAAAGLAAEGLYLPGVSPTDYTPGMRPVMKANSMTGKGLPPFEYYSLPYCKPEGFSEKKSRSSLNLGEFLAGDRADTLPYNLFFMKNENCRLLCKAPLEKRQKEVIVDRIIGGYRNNFILDNLPAKGFGESGSKRGWEVGFCNEDECFLHNDVRITIGYHMSSGRESAPKKKDGAAEDHGAPGAPGGSDGSSPSAGDGGADGGPRRLLGRRGTGGDPKFRIVSFSIEPFNVLHDEATIWTSSDLSDAPEFKSCLSSTERSSAEPKPFPLTNAVEVVYTYSVVWVKSNTTWASRWDIYLDSSEDEDEIQWLSICNALAAIIFMSGFIAIIIYRAVRRDVMRYSRVPSDEERADAEEDRGWKLVHGDVFRPPQHRRMTMCICLGGGAQVLLSAFFTIWFALLGFLSPTYRGSYLLGALFTYVLCAGASGYVSARFFRNFGGLAWRRNTLLTAFVLPGLLFLSFIAMNIALSAAGSSGAVPLNRMIIIVFLWFFVSVPLTFGGSYLGFSKAKWDLPLKVNVTKRAIPADLPWFAAGPTMLLIGGFLPFGVCFSELIFMLSSLWASKFFYLFGFLAITFVLVVIASAEVAILGCYFQLTVENWAWWWRAFLTPAASGLYIMVYSAYYYTQMVGEGTTLSTTFIFFAYMSVVSAAFALACGFVGVSACFTFIRVIYSAIKID